MSNGSSVEALIDQGRTLADDAPEQSLALFDEAVERAPDNAAAAVGRIHVLRMLGRIAEADTAATDALAHFPDDPDLLDEHGWISYAQGDHDASLAAFDRVLELRPETADAVFGRATSLRFLERYEEAEAALDAALTSSPQDVRLLDELGLLCYDRDDYEGAVAAFTAALDVAPNDELSLGGRASSLRLLARYDEAATALESALAAYPQSILMLNEQGWVRYALDDYEGALVSFGAVLQLDPSNEPALRATASSLRLLKRFDEAATAMDAALAVWPQSAPLLTEQGWLAYDRDDYEQAIEAFAAVIALDPTHGQALWGTASSLRMLKRYDEAAAALERALALSPDSVLLLNEQGWLCYDRDDYDGALVAFDDALVAEPGHEQAQWGKASSLRLLKRFDEAEAALDAALAAHPESIALVNERGLLKYDRDDYEGALGAFGDVLARDPQHEQALRISASSLRFLKRFDEGDRALDVALAAYPESIALHNERGWLRYDRGDYEGALAAFEQVLDLSPDNDDALAWKAISLRYLKRFDDADAVLNRALELYPENVQMLSERGWLSIEFASRNLDDSEAHLERALAAFTSWEQVAPGDPGPLVGLLDVRSRQRSKQEAALVASRLESAEYATSALVREQLGWYYLREKQVVRARQAFEFVVESTDNVVGGETGLGAVAFDQTEYDVAEEFFRRVVERSPDDPLYLLNLAWSLARQRGDKLPEAETRCHDVLRLDPSNSNALSCLGVISYQQGRLRDSEDYLLRSVEVGPNDGGHTDLGALYVKMARYDEAAEHLVAALAIDSDDTQARVELAGLYVETGKWTDAIREARRAVARDPQSEDGSRALALALWRNGDPREAERVLRDAIRRLEARRRWQLHLVLARLLVERGDKGGGSNFYEEALREVAEAKQLAPDQAEPYFRSGEIHYRQREFWSARKDFQECVRLDPTDTEAKRNAERINSQLIRGTVQSSRIGGAAVALLCFTQLVVVWVFYLRGDVSETVLVTSIPILIGLFLLAFLLPSLTLLKLPGLEAEIRGRGDQLSSGPSGQDPSTAGGSAGIGLPSLDTPLSASFAVGPR